MASQGKPVVVVISQNGTTYTGELSVNHTAWTSTVPHENVSDLVNIAQDLGKPAAHPTSVLLG